jgi:hypothetical protein
MSRLGPTAVVLAVSLSVFGLARGEDRPGGTPRIERLPEPSPPRHEGSFIRLPPEAKGEAFLVERAFASAFARQDPQHVSRTAHFAWLPETLHVKAIVGPGSVGIEWVLGAKPNVWRTGWCGVIQSMDRQPDGSLHVAVKIQPQVFSTAYKSLMADYVIETYRFADGRIELIATDAATPRRNLQGFPIVI